LGVVGGLIIPLIIALVVSLVVALIVTLGVITTLGIHRRGTHTTSYVIAGYARTTAPSNICGATLRITWGTIPVAVNPGNVHTGILPLHATTKLITTPIGRCTYYCLSYWSFKTGTNTPREEKQTKPNCESRTYEKNFQKRYLFHYSTPN
jgi:hypothetical protein